MDPGFIPARRTATKFEEQLLGRGTECLNRAGTSGRGRGISCWDRHYREGKGYRLRVTAMQLAEVSLPRRAGAQFRRPGRSEEHTSELQSLMRSSYAVFCLQQKNKKKQHPLQY